MISCTVSATWSRTVSSPCYTKHGQRCDAILSSRITTVVMSRSVQLGLCCTIEPNCSGMSAHLAGASVTSAGALLSGRQSLEPWDTWQRRSPPR
jgi:hypothetical protein